LLEEFLKPLSMSMNKLADELHVPPNRITQIVDGRLSITGETALRLARYFGTSPEFWLGLQKGYDLQVAHDEFEAEVERQVQRQGGITQGQISLMDIDTDKIDEAVLALLHLTLHDGNRAWKGVDWEAMNRLYEKGFISNPVGKAKSVLLTERGLAESEKVFRKLFSKR